MATNTIIGALTHTSIDIQTVLYNRGTVPVSPPIAGQPMDAGATRILPGDLLNCSQPSQAMRLGNTLNSIHGNGVFINISGWRWRQYRTLTVSGSYAIVPRTDHGSVFIINSAGQTDITLNLTHADLLPGMVFRFARPTSVGNLIITMSNGTIINPASGATGTVITITQFGHATLRILADTVSGGPKAFLEEFGNATVS